MAQHIEIGQFHGLSFKKMEETMSLEKDTLIKFEEIEKRIHSLNKKITTTKSDLTEMNSSLVVLNNQLLNLQDFVENTETFNFYDQKTFVHGKKGYSTVLFDKINFLCKKNALTNVKISVSVHFAASTLLTYPGTFYIMLNSYPASTAIYSETFSFSREKDITFNFEYTFYPTQEANYFIPRITMSSATSYLSIELLNIDIEMTGRNIVFLQRNTDFKLYITKDNYYITKNVAGGGLYLKTPVSNVDISTFTEIPNVMPDAAIYSSYYPFNYTYIPKLAYDSETSKYTIDDSVDYFVFCVNTSGAVFASKKDPLSTDTLAGWSARGWIYTLGHPNRDYSQFVASVYSGSATGNFYPGIQIGLPLTATQLTLNGVKISGPWVSNCAVFAKNWEDNLDSPFMCVATDESGNSFLFPSASTTYIVPLGKGYQVNAYLQADGSVTVYMRWLNTVYKKTLIFNSETSQYELTPNVVEYTNTTEILEGYTTDLFIRDNTGNWTYQPAT